MKMFIKILTFTLTAVLVLSSSNTLNDNDNRLNKGEDAPKFAVKDVHGEKIKLKNLFKNDQKVLLVFLRHAWCPVCNFRTHELIQNYDALKNKGYEVVVVYESKQKQLIDFVTDYELPYKVIADPEGKLYEMYKVERNMQKVKTDAETNTTVQETAKTGMGLYAKKEGKQYTDYKAEEEQNSDLIPADFVLDSQGNIETVYYGKFLGDHLPIKDILNAEPSAKQPLDKEKKENVSKANNPSKSKDKESKTSKPKQGTPNNVRF